jgi:nucleoside-diphosphate-sugar epimerase
MNVLVTGATGVIGRQAVPRLLQAGHEVTGVARSVPGASWLRAVGATLVEVVLFDPAMVAAAVTDADAVVHLATAIPPLARMRRPGTWRTNDRLRTHATRSLVDAAIAPGAEVFVQESVSFVYADGGAAWLDEFAAVDPPVAATRSALVAEAETDRFASAGGGREVALRMARLYGPGRASAELADMALARRVFVVGHGNNHVSSLHVEDAGTAVAAALAVPSGIYNVGDDAPVTALRWTASLAAALGAPPPRRLPVWVARRLLGSVADLLVVSQRVSNQAFRRAAGWEPRYLSVAAGWPTVGTERRRSA